jgi:Arc/MetJ family transcription regulator
MITANNTIYKDDFIDNGVEDKNYLRILFNGGRSVQIREVNQLQSILQSQIDKFGQSIWKSGTAVLGGACTFDNNIVAITFSTSLVTPPISQITLSEIDTLVQGQGDAAIIADVLGYDTNEVTTTFYVRYATGGEADNAAGVFDILTEIGLESRSDLGVISGSALSMEHTVVAGAFLADGVFFTNGSFVVTPKQSIFIDKPLVGDLSGSLVLNVVESYVNYVNDTTLLDNATGQPNHLAPGADRYQITLTLAYLDDAAVADTVERINLLKINDGAVVLATRTRYTDIDRQLAQRTYEESGNYITNPFKIDVSNLAGSLRPGHDDVDAADDVYVGLEPSVAYVDGYRIELGSKLDLTAPRARDTSASDVSVSLSIGNYVDVSLVAGSNLPQPNSAHVTYELWDAGTISPPVAPAQIGSCRIKAIETVGALYRVFLYDIALTGANNISDIARIYLDSGSNDVDLTVAPGSTVQDTSGDTAVFKLPYNNVKSLAAVNPTDMTYVLKKIFPGTVNPSNQFVFSTGANETFGDASVGNILVEHEGTWLATTDFTVVTSSSSSITIKSSGTPWVNGDDVTVIFPVTVASNVPASKTLTQVTQSTLIPSGDTYALPTTDIFDIVSVVVDGTATDVKSDIIISFDGQTASKYTNSQLKYTGAGTPPTIEVVYRYFVHSGMPFTANSYPINWDEDDVLGATEIRYKDVPTFNQNVLTDCIDFRPTILATPGIVTAIQPDPNSVLTCTPTFFLPRVDKLIVNSNGEFKIINGVPRLAATAPVTPPASMSLYELEFPAYTFDASDIRVKYVDNRRYTMRDIGSIDRRVSSLEYYTSLSLLETSANNKSIFDSVQGQRFKNGMLIDSFNGHSVGNVFNPAYVCSIDVADQTLRPHFKTDAVDLVLNSSTNVSMNENTITMAFTETPLISQTKSSESESVNPYEVATFIGSVKLYPTNDTWVDVNTRPAVIVNQEGAYDALKYVAKESNILGTEWKSWKTNWAGVVATVKSPPHTVVAPDGHLRRTETTVVAKVQNRVGWKTKLTSNTVTENLGERIVDVSFVPFIRSRRVYFNAQGLKPLTKVYPFFDGIDISGYTAPTASVVTPSTLTNVREYFGKTIGSTGFITAAPLVSTADGTLIGNFIIPNNSSLKFRTGERVFRLSDSPTNNLEEETTYADGVYNASGTAQSVESTILSTRVPVIKKERVRKTRVAIDTKIRWFDPLAQTFLIDDIAEGVFVTSLDLWFTSKTKSKIPVTARIVTVDNGYPTQQVVPFSEVTLLEADVNIDGSLTKFEFSDPVYLKGGTEYAIVLVSNDPLYRVKVSRLGGTGEDGKVIQTNPYGGTLFMSQNASTWTADQTRDLKFVLNRAVFTPGVTGTAEFKSILREGIQSIEVTAPGSGYVAATVSIAAPTELDGTQAYADAVIDIVSGTLAGVTVTDPGSGYAAAPLVTIVPVGPGTLATAVAHMYSAPTSAFNLIQSSSVQKESALTNTLTFGATTYTDVDSEETYEAASEFTITKSNRATIASSLTTTSQYISPVIDLDSMALLTIENEVNTLTTNEDTLDAGSALSRYITREVDLNDPADQLNIYLDVSRPEENSTIALYVKLKYDANTYSDWIPVAPQVRIPVTTDRDEYSEVQYIYDSSLNDFISFSVKIVFTAAATPRVTTVKNLRIIATS